MVQGCTSRIARGVKRDLDLVIGGLLAVAALPVVLLCAAAVKLVDPGPAFFRQLREGRNGTVFVMWKLRTMRLDAEAAIQRWIAADPALERQWREFRRLSPDPRILPVIGGFMRRTSLDELPQLWNVLRGEMSLIGPRPLEMELIAQLPQEHLERRRSIRPGLTGLWQVSGRSEMNIDELQVIDDRYIREWSLALDLRILFATPRALVSGRGAY